MLLSTDGRSAPVPVQLYKLDGSSELSGVTLEISSASADAKIPKHVSLRLEGISRNTCIQEGVLKDFISAYFDLTASRFLPGTPIKGVVFTTRQGRIGPNVWASYRRMSEGLCVDVIAIFYLPKTNEWGH